MRYREILGKHPEIRALFTKDPIVGVITVGVVALQLACAYVLSLFRLDSAEPIALFVASAYLVGSILNHWCAMTVHETSHFTVYRSRRANLALALFANIPFVFPMAMTFHRYHLDHHRELGVVGADTDLPHRAETRLIGRSRTRKFFWLLNYFWIYSIRGLTFIAKPNRLEGLNVVTQGVALALLWPLLGFQGVAYLMLSSFFGMSLHPVAAHFIHEHYVFNPGQETYSYYGPLNRVTYNVGYHIEHHDFVAIPGRLLPKLRSLIPEYYPDEMGHTSWSKVLWDFTWSRDIGVDSRIVRLSRDGGAIESTPESERFAIDSGIRTRIPSRNRAGTVKKIP